LTHQHLDICRVREDGVRISPGGRRHATANSPAYLEASRTIVSKITERYGQHPAVIGWQVDNEFGCGETARSYGEHDRRAFHAWLREKYGTLEALNAAWGTQFWGMTYHDWAHIPVPGITTEPQSPAMRLDFRRFSSDAWVRFQRMQIEIIRKNSPNRWITHNFMVRHWSLDYWELAKDLDFVSYDNYPHGVREPAEVSMNLDIMWSLKRRAFWIMEQQPGDVNWHPYNPPVPVGQVRVWSHQDVAHGAEAVVYFRWRQGRFGQEQYHFGLLKWDATPSQAYVEAQEVAETFKTLPEFQRQPAKVGIFYDYNDLWALELEPHHKDFSYWNLVYDLYRPFWEANIPVDFLARGADLTGYETVIVPAAFLSRPDEASQWKAWVEEGGKLLITFRTGVRYASNISVDVPLPATLTELIGGKVTRFMTSPPADYTAWAEHRVGKLIRSVRGAHALPFHTWGEVLQTETAEALYHFEGGHYDGQPCITRHAWGGGEVIYVGCWLEDFGDLLRRLGWLRYAESGLQKTLLHGVDGSRWHLEINHTSAPLEGLGGFGVRYTKADDDADQ
jgi:beta-galactosidase